MSEHDEVPTIAEIQEWRASRRNAGHSSDADLLALGRLIEARWVQNERRRRGSEVTTSRDRAALRGGKARGDVLGCRGDK